MKAALTTKNTQTKKQQHTSFIKPKGESDLYKKTSEASFIQAKLAIGQPNDKYEKEADAVAAKIVSKTKKNIVISSVATKPSKPKTNPIQRKREDDKEEEISQIQLKPAQHTNLTPSSAFESKLKASKGSGSPMTNTVKTEMESGFGRNFDNVRIHTGSNTIQMSKDVGAKAFYKWKLYLFQHK
jgi:hypothetical protein